MTVVRKVFLTYIEHSAKTFLTTTIINGKISFEIKIQMKFLY